MKTKLVMMVVGLVAVVALQGKGQTISMVIFDTLKSETIPFANVDLLDSSGKKIKSTVTDIDGNCSFDKIALGIYRIKTHYVGYGDSLFSRMIIRNDTSLRLNIRKPCKYDKSINNKICPVCHQTDKVIPICYGLVVYEHRIPLKDSVGKEVQLAVDSNECYFAGCVISGCDPNWYCKRDNLQF